jgi:hypothetical protein
MTPEDIKSLSTKSREDGKRLFGVCDFIYKLAMVGVWLIGIVGALASVSLIIKDSLWPGIGLAIIVFIICFANYMLAVLTTHVAKVLVHTSFANIAILEHLTKEDQR